MRKYISQDGLQTYLRITQKRVCAYNSIKNPCQIIKNKKLSRFSGDICRLIHRYFINFGIYLNLIMFLTMLWILITQNFEIVIVLFVKNTFYKIKCIFNMLYWTSQLVAGVGFEPTTFRLWAWRATGLLHPAIRNIQILLI